jgi:hypothetical protein
MSVLWNVYLNDEYNPFGGRVHLGFAGWHNDAGDAMAEARKRFPDIDPSRIAVNRV